MVPSNVISGMPKQLLANALTFDSHYYITILKHGIYQHKIIAAVILLWHS